MEKNTILRDKLNDNVKNWFLSDSSNKYRIYNKYRWYFIDYDNYRDVVVSVYEKFSHKIDESPDSKYGRLKYFYSAFINKAKDNLKSIKKHGNEHLLDFDEYTCLKSMMQKPQSYNKRAIDSVRTVHYIMQLAGLTHDQMCLYILSKVQKQTHESIAEELGISSSTVKYRLSKIRQAIKSVVTSKCIGDFTK